MKTLLQQDQQTVLKRLAGKTALVTGGSRGIGAAIALRLAEEGATVMISYNSKPEKASEVVARITELGGSGHALRANVTSEPETQYLIEETVKQIGEIDILVNNAGVFESGPLGEIDRAHYDRVFDVNVKGPIVTTIAALSKMRDGGRIINISSVAGKEPVAGFSVYSATKAALNSLTQSWAQELGSRGITVNAVAPGTTDTDMYQLALPDEAKTTIPGKTALGRVGLPEDIAAVVAFLASDDGGWLTGQVIYADGGLKF